MATKKTLVPLTKEEEEKRINFIGKAVDTNAILPYSSRVGVINDMTAQDVSNANEATLIKIGKHVESLIRKNTDSKFDDTPTRKRGITESDWEEFILLTLKKKRYETARKENLAQARALKKELEGLETDDEKRARLQAQLESFGPLDEDEE